MRMSRCAIGLLMPALFLYATSTAAQRPARPRDPAVARIDKQHEKDLIEVSVAGLTKTLHSVAPATTSETHVWLVEQTAWPISETAQSAIRASYPRATFVMSSDSAVDCPPGTHLSYPLHPCPIKDNGAIASIGRPYVEGDSAWVDVRVNPASEGMTFARIKGIWTFIRYYRIRVA